jgi:hypothetical protein
MKIKNKVTEKWINKFNFQKKFWLKNTFFLIQQNKYKFNINSILLNACKFDKYI